MEANYTETIQEIINQNIDVFEDIDYELYDETKKEYLQKRFLDYYMFREIGFETYSIWKFKFKERWNNLIIHYNKLWTVNEQTIEPFSEMVIVVDNELRVKDTPLSEDDESDYLTGKQNTKTKTDGRTRPLIELVDLYNKKLVNITERFILEFRDLFMLIY